MDVMYPALPSAPYATCSACTRFVAGRALSAHRSPPNARTIASGPLSARARLFLHGHLQDRAQATDRNRVRAQTPTSDVRRSQKRYGTQDYALQALHAGRLVSY
jgi:hypothetical protein